MNEIEKAIREIQTKHGIHGRKKAWLAGCAAFVFVMVLAAILDRSMMFSGLARWSGWALGLAIATLAAWLAKGAAAPDTTTLAHKIEADAGETAPVVVTSIDPAVRRLAGKEPFGDALLKRLDQRAEDAMKAAPPSFMGSLKIPYGILAAALASVVVLLSLQGGNGLLRMMIPWYTASYTSLSLEAPKQPIAEGKPFTLNVQASGIRPEKISLFRVGSDVVVAEGTPDDRGFVKLSVAGLESSAEFVARASDGVSGSVLVETYALPEIAKFEIVITPPAYTRLETRTEIDPSFTVIRASRLKYRLHLDAPAVSVKLERSAFAREDEMVTEDDVLITEDDEFGQRVSGREKDSGAPVLPVFRRDPNDPLVWEMDWELPKPESIVYRIVIEGERGDLIRNDEPWRINVLPDKPPTIRILSEDSAEVVKTGKEEVRIELGAVDDIRLASVRLIFRKPGSPYTTVNIDLPADTARTWTGAELLALAPMELKPLDIVAVHAETEDGNTLDGPGMARSDVVFIEIPLPEDEGEGDDGGGDGEGGSGSEPINPLELQKEVLRGTLALAKDSPEIDRQTLVNDQRQNAEYAGMMAGAMASQGATEMVKILGRAQAAMEAATVLLGSADPVGAVPREEAALGALIEAAQALGDAEVIPMPPPEADAEMMTFTLRPEKPKPSEPEDSEETEEKDEETLRELIEKVKKQLAEQEALNQKAKEEAEKEATGEPSDKPSDKPGSPSDKPSDKPSDNPGSPSETPSGKPTGAPSGEQAELGAIQQQLAQATREAANIAKGMKSSADSTGDPKAASEDLADAADLQDALAEALEGGEGELDSELGEKTSDALKGALEELNALLKTRSDEGGDRSVGYERLISDYLRSISYE